MLTVTGNKCHFVQKHSKFDQYFSVPVNILFSKHSIVKILPMTQARHWPWFWGFFGSGSTNPPTTQIVTTRNQGSRNAQSTLPNTPSKTSTSETPTQFTAYDQRESCGAEFRYDGRKCILNKWLELPMTSYDKNTQWTFEQYHGVIYAAAEITENKVLEAPKACNAFVPSKAIEDLEDFKNLTSKFGQSYDALDTDFEDDARCSDATWIAYLEIDSKPDIRLNPVAFYELSRSLTSSSRHCGDTISNFNLPAMVYYACESLDKNWLSNESPYDLPMTAFDENTQQKWTFDEHGGVVYAAADIVENKVLDAPKGCKVYVPSNAIMNLEDFKSLVGQFGQSFSSLDTDANDDSRCPDAPWIAYLEDDSNPDIRWNPEAFKEFDGSLTSSQRHCGDTISNFNLPAKIYYACKSLDIDVLKSTTRRNQLG
jgi:hypothetical protein